jgi:hypothetical protein
VTTHDFEVSSSCGASCRFTADIEGGNADDYVVTCTACGNITADVTDLGAVRSAGPGTVSMSVRLLAISRPIGQSVRVTDDPGAEPRQGGMPQYEREDIAAMLTKVRSLLLQVMANNHHPDRIVTLPKSAMDAIARAQEEIAEACQQMLDNWDAVISSEAAEKPGTP